MSRSILLCAFVVIVLHLCRCGVISATPLSDASDSNVADEVRHGVSLHTTDEQQEQFQQHYLHSMISELLTKVLIDPFKQIVTMMALYLEIFSVACGSHIISSANTGPHPHDREQQLIAIASTNLWLKLPLTETLNDIFINASLAVIPSILLDNSSSQGIPGILKGMFENIERTILANDTLAPLYREEKAKAEKLSLGPLANGTGNPDAFYKINPRFRAFIVRRQLLENLSGYDLKSNNSAQFQRHLLSQAVIRLAKTAKSDRMQEIFDQTVQTTMEKIDPTSEQANPSGVIDKILFSTLQEKFNTTPELENEFADIKNELLKKYQA